MSRLFRSFIVVALCLCFYIPVHADNTEIDSLMALMPSQKGSALCDTYLKLGEKFLYVNPEKAVKYGNLALKIAQDSQADNQACYANLVIASGYIYTGNFSEGERYSQMGLKLAKKLDNKDYICMALSTLSSYYLNTGEYDLALKLSRETLSIAQANDLEGRAARAKMNIGSILTNKGDRAEGLRYLTEALQYFESKDDVAITARILNNIAVNYHTWKDYDLALKYYRKTLRSYERTGDIVGKVIVLNNIGEIYKDKGQYNMALKYYGQIFDLAKTNDINEFYLAIGWVGMAETYMKLGEDTLAQKYADKSLAIFQKTNMQEGQVNANLILSQLDLNHSKLTEARKLVQKCLAESSTMGIKELIQKSYLLNSSILQKQGLYRDALESYKSYIQITDSLDQENETHQLALHRAELDISEKENEIELLQKDNEIKDLQLNKQKSQTRTLIVAVVFLVLVIGLSFSYNKARKKANILLQEKNDQISKQHKELVVLNQTKDKFLSIIGHDLRNPIGAFKDMISQLVDFPEMFTDELRVQILDELREEAESTYFLLDNLLFWAKGQKDSIQFKPEKIKLSLIIKNNIILNSRIAERKGVELKSDVDREILAYADHNMVDLIVRNLMSNAIKFTPQNGKVVLSVEQKGEFCEVAIADSGIGIDEKNIKRLFEKDEPVSTYGTNNEKGSGLGLVLCKEFVEINGGGISVQSELGKGSTFRFTLKKFNPPKVQNS